MTMTNGSYPAGAPCWVETLQPDPRAAATFYGALLGWRFDDDALEPARVVIDGEYLTARIDGHRVAGIGTAPPEMPALWMVDIRVGDVDETVARVEKAGGRCLLAPSDGDGSSRVALLTDSTGVPFGVRHSDGPLGAELVDEPGAWAMASLHSADLREAERFYGAVLGWRLDPARGAPFSTWRLGDDVVGLLAPAGDGSTPQHWSINVAVADADVIAARATTLGGMTLMPPFDTPGFRNTVVADPQGAVIAFSARTSRGAAPPAGWSGDSS